MEKICIITTVHTALDTRIFYREAISLAKKYKVVLIAPAEKDFEDKRIKIRSLGIWKTRFQRFFKNIKALKISLNENADIYHFHDPEFIIFGIILKFFSGKPVIYDIHENNPEFILDKAWIPTKPLRWVVSYVVRFIENIGAIIFSGIIVTNERLLNRFKSLNRNTELVMNFPDKNFRKDFLNLDFNKRKKIALFTGGIEKKRGVMKILEFIKKYPDYDLKFQFIGRVKSVSLETEIKKFIQDEKIPIARFEIVPQVPLEEIPKYLNTALIGLIPLLRTRNNFLGTPQKTFEYMAYGLPIVASDFYFLRKFIDGSGSGILVKDPENLSHYKRAFDEVVKKDTWQKLSLNGQKAFQEKYNWEREEAKLLILYKRLLKEN